MCSSFTKTNIKSKRVQFNRFLFDFAVTRPYTIIIVLALLCTLTAKLYYAQHCSRLSQYPGWILSDVAFFIGLEVLLAFLCYVNPKSWSIRFSTLIASIACIWSFLNAGWLIRTGNAANNKRMVFINNNVICCADTER